MGRYQQLVPTDGNDIVRDQLSASTCFDFAVHCDVAILDQELGVTARFRESGKLQELIEPDLVGLGNGINFVQARCPCRREFQLSSVGCGPSSTDVIVRCCRNSASPLASSVPIRNFRPPDR